jgi:hypothetical protein
MITLPEAGGGGGPRKARGRDAGRKGEVGDDPLGGEQIKRGTGQPGATSGLREGDDRDREVLADLAVGAGTEDRARLEESSGFGVHGKVELEGAGESRKERGSQVSLVGSERIFQEEAVGLGLAQRTDQLGALTEAVVAALAEAGSG